MGNFKAVFERAKSQLTFTAGEYLGRHEHDWENDPFNLATRNLPRVFRPDDVYPPTVSIEGPASVRSSLRPLISFRNRNGKDIEPFSVEETAALTEAMAIRFEQHEVLYRRAAKIELDPDDPDFEWQQKFLDAQERILCGYVNLVSVINFETLAQEDPTNVQRVEEFLAEHKDTVFDVFSKQGGAPAFIARVQGLDTSRSIGAHLVDALNRDGLDLTSSRTLN